ncbi:alcohol dehydrogenase/S-(hydroxymethyl)glutathione dehydrogenase/alcohol dehydrogenase [Tamaricihabitans halophyticus]|uniref:Alcohol dehydrogenase/S-(Hydroxymethyl)glutathione dehydrogenase/alcohol dehydrogenase n=1 Tax=Tamaricihabitans halophyticus TaxID=1262583 RepID=A0A4R2QH92_9PSEU|nr:Zn-dependent alcohol dehydrogenase [Tamaricihabitans halophyticus]TCP47954.1 alcohol dehydrogenase/S-(hydroxymethyl)glutathione dehydrogenase/alcohol dehydrogenase [Tamaricihabitans halophyticus]
MHVNAAVLTEHNGPLRQRELWLDGPGPQEVLVKIAATSVCASDTHTRSGRIPSPLPVVLGHEGAGVVAATGRDVTGLAPGDHVALSWMPNCGRCRYCSAGRPVLCSASAPALLNGTLLDGTVRMRDGEQPVHHYSFLSTFADHAVVPASSAIRIRHDVPLAVAALVGCGVLTGYGAVVNRAKVEPGSSVLIYGAGGVGLSAVFAAHNSGALRIIVVDPRQDKRDGAAAFGATHVLDPEHEDVATAVRAMTDGAGADVTIDAVGREGLLAEAFDATAPGGTIVCVGVPGPEASAAVPGARFVREEKYITGSLYGSSRPAQDIPRLLDLFAAGRLPVDKLISRTYSLAGINEAFTDTVEGHLRRGVVVVDEALAW